MLFSGGLARRYPGWIDGCDGRLLAQKWVGLADATPGGTDSPDPPISGRAAALSLVDFLTRRLRCFFRYAARVEASLFATG